MSLPTCLGRRGSRAPQADFPRPPPRASLREARPLPLRDGSELRATARAWCVRRGRPPPDARSERHRPEPPRPPPPLYPESHFHWGGGRAKVGTFPPTSGAPEIPAARGRGVRRGPGVQGGRRECPQSPPGGAACRAGGGGRRPEGRGRAGTGGGGAEAPASSSRSSPSSSSSPTSPSSSSSSSSSSPSYRCRRLHRAEERGVRGAGLGLRDGELAPRRRQWPQRNRPPPPGLSRRGRGARPARPGARPAGGGDGGAGQVDAAGRWRPRARAASGGGAGGCSTGSRWCSSAFCSAGPTTPTPSSCA